TVSRQKVRRDALQDSANRRGSGLRQRRQSFEFAHEQLIARMFDWTALEKLRQAARHAAEDRLQASRRVATGIVGRQMCRPLRQKTIERALGDEAPLEQCCQAYSGAGHPKLREDERDVWFRPGKIGQRSQGMVERLFD